MRTEHALILDNEKDLYSFEKAFISGEIRIVNTGMYVPKGWVKKDGEYMKKDDVEYHGMGYIFNEMFEKVREPIEIIKP